jgi:hypothetical protein
MKPDRRRQHDRWLDTPASDIGICQNEEYLNAWGCGKAGPQPNQPPALHRGQEDYGAEAAENRWRARPAVDRQ